MTLLILILALLQQPQPISCTITATDQNGHHAVCEGRNPNPVCKEHQDEPECKQLTLTWAKGAWPAEWVGSREPGSVYRVRWTNGEHKPLPSATRCREVFERRRRAHRPGINDGVRNPNYFIPEDCESFLTSNKWLNHF